MEVVESVTPKAQINRKLKSEPTPKKSSGLKKLDLESVKVRSNLRERANKKPFGRKVKESEIIGVALKLIKDEHLAALQESTYSEKNRLGLMHEQYQKQNGKLTMDQFLGKLLRGEVTNAETKTAY